MNGRKINDAGAWAACFKLSTRLPPLAPVLPSHKGDPRLEKCQSDACPRLWQLSSHRKTLSNQGKRHVCVLSTLPGSASILLRAQL